MQTQNIRLIFLLIFITASTIEVIAAGYRKEIAATISYGSGDSQVQVVPAKDSPGAGPDFVAGDTLGNTFLAGSASQRIQKFDRTGKFAFVSKLSGLSQFTTIVPDNLGGLWGVYSMADNSREAVFHCNSGGQLTVRTPVSKLGSRRDTWFGFGPMEVSCERTDGVLRLRMGSQVRRLSRDGKLLKSDAGAALQDDKGISYELSELEANWWEFRSVDEYGSPLSIRKLTARPPKGIKPSQARFGSVPIGIDGAGYLYIVWHIIPKKRIILKNGLKSWSDLYVQRYSPKGTFISELLVGQSWDYENYPNPSIDRKGRIYTLDYSSTGARIIRWSP